MFSAKYFLSAIALASSSTAAILSAVPASAMAARAVQASPSITLCSGTLQQGCINTPVVSDSCVSFTGGLSFLDETLSTAVIPAGFVCTFFSAFGCESDSPNDRVVLTGGTWSFFQVPGNTGTTSFNDRASSFSCSPI